MYIYLHKYLYLTWETIKASFRGLTKKVLFPRFRFLFLVFQPGIVAVLRRAHYKRAFAFIQAKRRARAKTA